MGKGDQEVTASTKEVTVSLRTYVESLILESNKRADVQFGAAKEAVTAALAAAEKAVSAALVAQDKLTTAAFVAAKEALAEAQTQLTLYKTQSNEWRATLTDLIAKIMMRPEILMMFGGVDATIKEIKTRLTVLEGKGERSSGKEEAAAAGKTQNQWTFERVLTIIALLIAAMTYLLRAK